MAVYSIPNKRWFVEWHGNNYWFLSHSQAEEFIKKKEEE